jgi:hypothetical protein
MNRRDAKVGDGWTRIQKPETRIQNDRSLTTKNGRNDHLQISQITQIWLGHEKDEVRGQKLEARG